jgi:hypothetical protein
MSTRKAKAKHQRRKPASKTVKRVILLSGLPKKNTSRKTQKYRPVNQSGGQGSPPKLPSGPSVPSKLPSGPAPPVPSRASKPKPMPTVKPPENPYNKLPTALNPIAGPGSTYNKLPQANTIVKSTENPYMTMKTGVNPFDIQTQGSKFQAAVSSVIQKAPKEPIRTMSNVARYALVKNALRIERLLKLPNLLSITKYLHRHVKVYLHLLWCKVSLKVFTAQLVKIPRFRSLTFTHPRTSLANF